MTVEAIAEVVADIRAGRVWHPLEKWDKAGRVVSQRLLLRAQTPQPVVDCTAVNRECQRRGTIHLYEDHPQITPPWEDAMLCYVNSYGNVLVLQTHRSDFDSPVQPRDWYTENEVDWPQVRWLVETTIWLGGKSQQIRHMPTAGPCHMFRHAVGQDGTPLDIAWVALMEPDMIQAINDEMGAHSADPTREYGYPLGRQSHRGVRLGNEGHEITWGAPLVTVGAALNFLNASNTDIAEPARPRPTRRRLARIGVSVQTIVVRPPGKRRIKTGEVRPLDTTESVLSPVRGHWAHYGPRYNRGLLFGKHEGKYWISGFVRGAGSDEEAPVRDYALQPKTGAGP